MADIAPTYGAAPGAGPTRAGLTQPSLTVVRDVQAHADESGESRTWHHAAVGAAVGFAITAVVILVVGTLAGIGAGGALGLGLFVGGFGGVGFGFMMGGMASFAKQLDGHATAAVVRQEQSR